MKRIAFELGTDLKRSARLFLYRNCVKALGGLIASDWKRKSDKTGGEVASGIEGSDGIDEIDLIISEATF